MEGELALLGKKKYAFLFSDAILLCEVQYDDDERKLTAYRMIPLSLAVTTDLPSTDSMFTFLSFVSNFIFFLILTFRI